MLRKEWNYTLAAIQVDPVAIVRGIGTIMPYENWHNRDEIPADYRDMCSLVKFQSTGWRNVSVWGLFGILGAVVAISLGSVRTEDGRFWLIIAAHKLWQWIVLLGRWLLEVSSLLFAVMLACWIRVRARLPQFRHRAM